MLGLCSGMYNMCGWHEQSVNYMCGWHEQSVNYCCPV